MTAEPLGPLILTASLDPASQGRFERERRQHFPSSLNVIPAHVTLFHHLPGEHVAEVQGTLADACAGQPPAPFTATGLRFLGRGTAYVLAMPEHRRPAGPAGDRVAAVADRAGPAALDAARDRAEQGLAPEAAKRLHAALLAGFVPQEGTVLGLRCGSIGAVHGVGWVLGNHSVSLKQRLRPVCHACITHR